MCVEQCAHGLAVFHVAVEEAGAKASMGEKGLVSPGTLRSQFLDALHYLEENEVYSKANIAKHTGQLKADK